MWRIGIGTRGLEVGNTATLTLAVAPADGVVDPVAIEFTKLSERCTATGSTVTCPVSSAAQEFGIDFKASKVPITVTITIKPDGDKGEVDNSDNVVVLDLVP